MSNQDDFNIFPEEPTEPGWSSRPWVWVLLIAAIAIFAFAVGMAFSTFSNRMNNGEANTLPTPTSIETKVAVPTFTRVPTTSVTATAPTNGQPTRTTLPAAPTAVAATPTVPAVTPTLAGCPRAVYAPFVPVYDGARLGCAVNDAGLVWSAWEAFERGYMFWRSDNNRAYAFFTDNSWLPVNERWDGQPVPSRGEPPSGLRAPERGFGYAWGVRDDFFQRLGWAADQERGFCAVIQSFDRGFILQSSDVEFCQDNLYNHARVPEWQPLFLVVANDGSWRNFAGGTAPVTPPTSGVTPTIPPPLVDATATALAIATPLPTATTVVDPNLQRSRPSRNGTFIATTQVPASLDGSLSDWPGTWYPINAVVQGNNNYAGPDDIGGDFQVAWSPDGLYLAVRVRDDAIVPARMARICGKATGLNCILTVSLLSIMIVPSLMPMITSWASVSAPTAMNCAFTAGYPLKKKVN